MNYRHIRLSPARQQRGAVAVFAAIILAALLISALMVIEIGRVYGAQRTLQKMASLAALDAARKVSGCGEPSNQAAVDAAVAASLLRNGDPALLTSTVVEVGVVETNANSLRELSPTDFDEARAVRVTLTRPFPSLLTPLLMQGGGVMTASGTAEQAVLGSFYLGSGLLGLNTVSSPILNALLGGLLGSNVNLTALDYQGLAGVGVSLGVLATALNVDVQDLSDPVFVETQTPVLDDALSGLAGALSGTASGAVTGLLQQLAGAAQGQQVPLGLILEPATDIAANVPFVNLLDLIIALGAAANADASGSVQPIALPVSVGIPNVTSLHTFVQILEPPRYSGLGRPGRTQATTAQIKLLVRLQADVLSTLTDVLNPLLLGVLGSVQVDPIKLGIDVNVAKASGFLDRIDCPSSSDPMPIAYLSAEPSAATVTLGTFVGNASNAPPIAQGSTLLTGVRAVLLNLPGLQLADVRVNVFVDEPVTTNVGSGVVTPLPLPITEFTRVDESGSGDKPFWIADSPVAANPQTVGSTNLLNGALSTLFGSLNLRASSPNGNESSSVCILRILGICTLSVPLGPILDGVIEGISDVLDPLLTGVGGVLDAIIDPLLRALGIQVGSATVTMSAVTIDQPKIVSKDTPVTAP